MNFPFIIVHNDEIKSLKGKISLSENNMIIPNAVTVNSKVQLLLMIPKILASRIVELCFYDEGMRDLGIKYVGEWVGTKKEVECYQFDFNTSSLKCGLYFYKLIIRNTNQTIYCYPYFDEVRFSLVDYSHSPFQLTVYENIYPEPDNYYGGIIYHIFVDRFNRGGETTPKENAIIVDDWSGGIPEYPEKNGDFFENNTFFFGTIYGIIEKIKYIASLGVNIIYLSPIFESPSNHKYDTADYMRVDEMLGGDEALIKLIEQSQKLGISIILDGVFNHTGSDSIYFNKRGRYNGLGAFESKDSPYWDWYNFYDHPNRYECWWNIDILPRLNLNNPVCREFFIGTDGVVEKYAKMGIAGFRLDVVDELDDDFVASIKKKLSKYNSKSLLYGEVWEDASNKIAYGKRKKYYLGSELDGVMNYPLRRGLIDFFLHRGLDTLKYALTTVLNNAPKRVADAEMNILGTHDTARILTLLADENVSDLPNSALVSHKMSESSKILAIKRLLMAYTVLCTLPGIPTIFYGDEAGLEGYSDPFNRMPYPWGDENNQILDFYVHIGKIRRNNSVYRVGNFDLVSLEDGLLLFKRQDGDIKLLTIVNNSDKRLELSINHEYEMLISGTNHSAFDSVTLDPLSAEIVKVKGNFKITLIK